MLQAVTVHGHQSASLPVWAEGKAAERPSCSLIDKQDPAGLLGAGKWDLEVKMKVKLSGNWQEMEQHGIIPVKNPARQGTPGTRLDALRRRCVLQFC